VFRSFRNSTSPLFSNLLYSTSVLVVLRAVIEIYPVPPLIVAGAEFRFKDGWIGTFGHKRRRGSGRNGQETGCRQNQGNSCEVCLSPSLCAFSFSLYFVYLPGRLKLKREETGLGDSQTIKSPVTPSLDSSSVRKQLQSWRAKGALPKILFDIIYCLQ
jgi:hypothetical protein